MKKERFYIIGLVLMLLTSILLVGCNDDEGIKTPETSTNGVISVVITTEDQQVLLKELPNKIPLTSDIQEQDLTIVIDENDTKQTVEGFGAALTGSSAVLLNNNQEALQMLFGTGEEGIDLSYTRLTVGASDFNKNESFTYNDIDSGEDLELTQFSIEKDKINDNPILPVAQSILAIHPEMKFLASPWSPPGWMKSNNNLHGGSLLPAYFTVYAEYLQKYIETYKAEGISINTITVQNEPLNEKFSYPTAKMSAADQATFIADHLGPKLVSAGLGTKIIAYDHNFTESENPNYAIDVLSDPAVKQYTNAVAYHAYNGKPADMDAVNQQLPDAEVYFTEQSGIQNDDTTFGRELDFFMKNVFFGTLRRGAKVVLLWNLALDENAGPKNGGCTNCRGVLEITSGGTIIKNVEYYMLGHFSKYIKPGAVVLGTNDLSVNLENVAFKNPDGSKVLVLYSTLDSSEIQKVNVKIGGNSFIYNLPRRALVTLIWD